MLRPVHFAFGWNAAIQRICLLRYRRQPHGTISHPPRLPPDNRFYVPLWLVAAVVRASMVWNRRPLTLRVRRADTHIRPANCLGIRSSGDELEAESRRDPDDSLDCVSHD